MGLARTWTGQVARAAGASVLAPLVLLIAAGVVASGGGVGGFGSLREVASGPPLPDIGLAATPGAALENADVVGAVSASSADPSRPPAAAQDALASTAPSAPVRAANDDLAATPRVRGRQPSVERVDPPKRPAVDGVTTPPPPAAPPAPGAPNPVDGLLEATRDLGDTLRAPLQPITDTLLELLRGRPPSR